jgi:Do/DeqQ family serine protease
MGVSAVACLLGAVVPLLTLSQAAVPTPNDMGRSVAPLVDSVKDAVVTIRSLKVITRAARSDPFTEMLREQFGLGGGRNQRQETQQGLGSGFIIDNRGTVYTNNHVVAGADEVQVVTSDGRVFAAKVEGSDPGTDVAVVRMTKPPGNLKTVKRGNSDKVRVGDYVLAIGNPLGLGQTVTMGIVSAKNRSIDDLIPLSDFIQTDAAINQGNSGGPLFNFNGEVIGINSAILNPARAMNVGFAIPINLAISIADQLVKNGKVGRGYLGVATVPFTPELAQRLGQEFEPGALVNSVQPKSPAEAAGIKANDLIVEIAGRRTENGRSLTSLVQSRQPGESLPVIVRRAGKRMTLQVKLTENVAMRREDVLGLSVQRLDARASAALGIPADSGVQVVAVAPRGPTSGTLQEGDIIVMIAGPRRIPATVENLREFEKRLQGGGRGQLIIIRDGEAFAVNF